MLDPFSYIYILGRPRQREREKKREERERESIARKNGKERMENVYNLSLPPEWWVGTS